MHIKPMLLKLLNTVIHKKRLDSMAVMVEGLIKTKNMSITGLGRGLKQQIKERSAIRVVDRFIGNSYYQENADIFYKKIIGFVVGKKETPELLIDWSKVPHSEAHVLRAALVASGRSITLYEEIHPAEKLGNRHVQERFLKKLKGLLPEHCKPIIITDAGFTIPWFKTVLELGWDYIGRVRQLKQTQYSKDGKDFIACERLEKQTTRTPTSLGEIVLSKKNPFVTWCYGVKQKIKGRKKRNKHGGIATDKDSKNYARSQREGWVLVSSIKANSYFASKRIIKSYSKRMTIEEGFRDWKSSQYGFSMENNKTIKAERLVVWMVLAALASLLAWITGYYAEKAGKHAEFQANTIKHRRVLSFFYLGCQVIRKNMKIVLPFSNTCFFEEVAT